MTGTIRNGYAAPLFLLILASGLATLLYLTRFVTSGLSAGDSALLMSGLDNSSTDLVMAHHVIMIDAGSSGSRVHVYTYRSGGVLPIFESGSKTMKLKPGLSSYDQEPELAGVSITELLQFAEKHVPDSLWSSTPVYLFATAGLRTIQSSQADEILDIVRRTIKHSPFHSEEHWVRIIPGRDEGMFGWIAANYLMENLHPSPRDEQSFKRKSTMGVLEMGGASMQVSFVPHESTTVDPDELIAVELGPTIRYSLYTHSYLQYGLEQAQHLLIKYPRPNYDASSTILANNLPEHPCYPVGFSFDNAFSGRGNYQQCQLWVNEMLDKRTNTVKRGSRCTGPNRSCSFSGVYQPLIGPEKFVAIENFFYTSEFFGAEKTKSFLDVLGSGSSKFCSAEWSSLVIAHPKESIDDLSKYCFSGVYIDAVLKRGLGIANPQESVSVVKRVNGAAVDWTLGAVVHAVANNKLKANAKQCTDFSGDVVNKIP